MLECLLNGVDEAPASNFTVSAVNPCLAFALALAKKIESGLLDYGPPEWRRAKGHLDCGEGGSV